MCMETNEVKNGVSKRKAAEHFFDKRLIKEIVQAVEDGLPRIEAQKCYGMSETTLCRWMAAYGSPEYHANKLRVYNPSLKRSVLRAIESGMSITEARISFGIKSSVSISSWIREASRENADLSYCNPDPMAKKTKNTETDEVKALKEALAYAQLKIRALDTMIDIAEEQLKIDIRKKSGARQSSK